MTLTSVIELSTLNGSNGFQINGVATGGESDGQNHLGAAVDLSDAPARPIDVKAVLRQATLTPAATGTPDETNR
jgi:hypothetical protein